MWSYRAKSRKAPIIVSIPPINPSPTIFPSGPGDCPFGASAGADGTGVGLKVGIGVGDNVGVGTAVADALGDGDRVGAGVGVGVGVAALGIGEGVGEEVGVAVGGFATGTTWLPAAKTVKLCVIVRKIPLASLVVIVMV